MATKLTQAELKRLLQYDPETGTFTRLVDRSRYKAGTVAGYDSQGYIDIRIGPKGYRAHRLAWLYMTGAWPLQTIDHINNVKSDNRWINLRDVSRAVNVRSIPGPRPENLLGIKGVRRTRVGNFDARITIEGRVIALGTYPTPEQASQAYTAAKRSST